MSIAHFPEVTKARLYSKGSFEVSRNKSRSSSKRSSMNLCSDRVCEPTSRWGLGLNDKSDCRDDSGGISGPISFPDRVHLAREKNQGKSVDA